jgi:nucleoside-diphosphate-sugar epimerase
MKILVTGGTGFLGSHTAAKLLDHRHTVYLLGRDFGRVQPLLKRGARPIAADLRNQDAVIAACAGMDAVVHAGALSSAWGAPQEFEAVNVGGTQAVIDGCRQGGVERLVHISSPAVIFTGEDHEGADERRPYAAKFSSHYGLSKKRAENLVNDAHAGGLATVILRPKAIFGPGDTSLLPRLLAAARAGRLRQFGDGKNRVDLTYVENVAHAIMLALDARAAVGRTYFITNDEHVLLWPLVRRLLQSLHLPHQLRTLPVSVALAAAGLMEWQARFTGREPLLTRYSVGVLARTQTYNIAAARRDLGYAPVVSIEDGVGRTLAALHAAQRGAVAVTPQRGKTVPPATG